MGVDLTKALFARHAAKLTAGELVVLGYMCLVALDKENGKGQTAGLYFAGWEPLAVALGYDGLTEAAKTKVKRAIKGCRAKGLIKPLVAHAQTGERQVYRILVLPTGGQKQTPNRGSGSDPQEGVNFRPDRGSDSDPPRTHTGRGQDLRQDSINQSATELQTARGDNDEIKGHKFEGNPLAGDCLVCDRSHLDPKAHPFRLIRGA